jgi:hypothetical protein
MTYVPYVTRHLQRTVEDHVYAYLDSLSWFGPAEDVPFGASVTEFQRGRMDEADLKAASGNRVIVSFGSEPDEVPQELGGGLVVVEHVMFVDCLGQNEAIALSLANDVKDWLSGRVPGASRYSSLYSYLTDPRTLVADHQLEFTDVAREEGNPAVRRYWQIVKATVELTSIGED